MTAEAYVWEIVGRAQKRWDLSFTIRSIAEEIGYSHGAVWKTSAWRGYSRFKRRPANKKQASLAAPTARRHRRKRGGGLSAEGRVWQIVRRATLHKNFRLTVKQIANRLKLSGGTVGGTMAWRGYADARACEAADNKRKLGERSKKL